MKFPFGDRHCVGSTPSFKRENCLIHIPIYRSVHKLWCFQRPQRTTPQNTHRVIATMLRCPVEVIDIAEDRLVVKLCPPEMGSFLRPRINIYIAVLIPNRKGRKIVSIQCLNLIGEVHQNRCCRLTVIIVIL